MRINKLPFLEMDKKKGTLGVVLGSVFFVLMQRSDISLKWSVLFFLLFVLVGFVRIRDGGKWRGILLGTLWTAACMVAINFFPYIEIFAYDTIHMILDYASYVTFPKNWLIIVIGYLGFYVLFGSWKSSVIGISVVLSALSIVNGYVLQYRAKLLMFSDLYAYAAAMNVAGQYDLSLRPRTIWMIALIVLALFCGFAFRVSRPEKKSRLRVAALAVALVLASVFGIATKNDSTNLWYWDGALTNGYYLNFYLSISDAFVDKPEQYSAKLVQEYEDAYPDQILRDGQYPDILVIMNESFADLRVISEDLRTNIEVMPFLDSLEENTIRGKALTSVFGGTTANAEFEFLTGFSMQLLPQGAMPYQQYIRRNTYSLAWALKELGYNCFATHPFSASSWDRTTVYPYLGFEEATFVEDYPQQNLVRSYVSDQEMYEYILDKLDSDSVQPQFVFGITMQNHGGYQATEENYVHFVELQNYSKAYPDSEVYLTLTNYSDNAMKYLLGELQKRSRDTIVLFFGDHFPTIESDFLEELYGGGFHTLDEKMLKYTVPFYIWANYDIEEETVPCTSLNYLGHYLLETAGIDLPPFFRFLKDMESVVPSINALGYYSAAADSYRSAAEAQGEELEWLEKYQILQYNGLFDKKNVSKYFFAEYTD